MNPGAHDREVIRCARCKLVQWATAKRDCRRCKASLPAAPTRKLTPPAVIAPKATVATTGALIKRMRTSRGLSQSELAVRMACPRTYISKLENGRVLPLPRTLPRIAKALACDVWELVGEHRPRLVDDPGLNEFMAAVLAGVTSLTHEQKWELCKRARMLLEQKESPSISGDYVCAEAKKAL